MEDPGQLLGSDLENYTDGKGRGAGGAEHVRAGHALLTEKVSGSEQRNRGFFAAFGNNGEFSPAHPKIKETFGAVSLKRKDLLRLDANDCSSWARIREVCIRIEGSRALLRHTEALHRERRLSELSSSVGMSAGEETADIHLTVIE